MDIGESLDLAGAQVLYEVPAGRMIREDAKVMPDPRKGIIRCLRANDGLLAFTWFAREAMHSVETGRPELVYIVFPGDAEFALMPNQKRVARLKLVESRKIEFFWFYQGDHESDIRLAKELHDVINARSPAVSSDVHKPEQEKPGEVDSRRSEAEASGAGPSPGQGNLNKMLSLLSQIQVPDNVKPQSDLDLSRILTVSNLEPVFEKKDVVQDLIRYLPADNPQDEEELRETMRSPQFQEQLRMLTEALRGDSFEALCLQLGLGASHPGCPRGVRAFLRAIRDQALQQRDAKPQ